MNNKEIIERLNRIEEAINTKGHPMQDYSTLKMAMLDVLQILKEMVGPESDTGNS